MNFSGVFPACTTHFFEDGSLDLDSLSAHIEVLIGSGVSGLVMLGSLGENNSLWPHEKLEVVRAAVSASAGRVPVLSGVSENTTDAAISHLGAIEKVGASGAMVLPCMSYHADQDEAIRHFSLIAESCDLPLIIYNNPIAYRVDLGIHALEALAKYPQYKAIKESSGDVRRITDLVNHFGDRFTLMCGVDDLALESFMLGCTGWIAGIGLAFPEENQRMFDLAIAGDFAAAREIYRWYMPLLHLDVGTKFVQKIKLAIQEVGLGREFVRSPRLMLSGLEREECLKVIRAGIAARPMVSA